MDATSTSVTRPGAIATIAATPAPEVIPVRDDRLEISIGAIHLRVEAPAPALSAQATPPAPAPARATTPRMPRSGLARRLLHRL